MRKLPTKAKNAKRKMQNITYFGFCVVVFSFTLYALRLQHASAQEMVRSFTITPPTITAPLAPGRSTDGVMKIRNDTDAPVTFNVSVQDFIVQDTHGTPKILPPDTLSNKYSAASWIGVSPAKFTVQPHERQELSYFIQIPKDARPGGHYAAVVYSPVTDKGVDSTGATVNSQIGTLFSVLIDGPITEKAEVTRFFTDYFQEYGPISVETQIKDLGDQHIRPVGNVTVTSWFGQESAPLHENNIFPEAARDYVNIFGQHWMFGRYVATLQSTYGKSNNLPLTATIVFWVFPWKLAIVIILFIIAAILAVMLMRKKKNDGNPPTAGQPAPAEQQMPAEQPAQPAA